MNRRLSTLSNPAARHPMDVPIAESSTGLSILQRVCRSILLSKLEGLENSHLVLRDGDERHAFGDRFAPLRCDVSVRHPSFYTHLCFGGSVGAGTAWMEGAFTADDLLKLIRIFARNRHVLAAVDGGLGKMIQPGIRALHALHRNSIQGSKSNISAHYDLGNDFFEEFLDPTMTYSSGIFMSEDATMEEASIEKLDRICRKLELTEKDHLLEIGTGWGSMAIHAARNYGCHVTTTTISEEQHALACERVAREGLEDRIVVLKEDYRNLRGRWNKLVSVEMIEAVGHDFHETFFETCSRCLTPDGRAVIQAITIPDQRYDSARKGVDFIKHFIFPGCCIPAMGRMTDCLKRKTDMSLTDVEDITLHYARTLNVWRQKLYSNHERIRELGYDEPFLRLWEFYLAYCEGGFSDRQIGTVQMVLDKPWYGRAEVTR